ncbi:MAG: PCRF domain-containing protein [Akkermansia sp.]|nr:PCRF domain-containing protein [Akkermansia sp.]
MLDKLRAIAHRYEETTSRLYQPEVTTQPELYRTLMQEANALRPIAEAYSSYIAQQHRLSEAEEMLSDADKELRLLAQEEYNAAKAALEQLTEEIKILLLPRDPNDDRNVIVEIRAGAGGEESALFAHSLYRMYTMYAERRGLRHEPISLNETELGGYKEVSFVIAGDSAYSRFKFESGVHRVQRVPETESQGRIQTSTATVAVLLP